MLMHDNAKPHVIRVVQNCLDKVKTESMSCEQYNKVKGKQQRQLKYILSDTCYANLGLFIAVMYPN